MKSESNRRQLFHLASLVFPDYCWGHEFNHYYTPVYQSMPDIHPSEQLYDTLKGYETIPLPEEKFHSNTIDKALSAKKKKVNIEIKESRSIHTYDFAKNISDLKSVVLRFTNVGKPFINGRNKINPSKSKKVSKRRSKYTGVTRNSSNYQTLIVINGKKTYVASYEKEVYAALTFDFYSLLLRGQRALTNFTYSTEEVKQMIYTYEMNDKKFDPSVFAYKTQSNA